MLKQISNVHMKTYAIAGHWLAPIAFALCVSLASCAQQQPTNYAQASTLAGSARFLNYFDFTSSRVVAQVNLPNSDTCLAAAVGLRKVWLQQMTKEFGATNRIPELESLTERSLRCSSVDVSKSLPFRATQRLKANGLLVDTYAISEDQCKQALGPEDPGIDVVSGCQTY